jgi:hypothetical protein
MSLIERGEVEAFKKIFFIIIVDKTAQRMRKRKETFFDFSANSIM